MASTTIPVEEFQQEEEKTEGIESVSKQNKAMARDQDNGNDTDQACDGDNEEDL